MVPASDDAVVQGGVLDVDDVGGGRVISLWQTQGQRSGSVLKTARHIEPFVTVEERLK